MRKVILISILSLLPLMVFAQTVIQIQNPLTATSVEALVDNLINFFFYIALALVPLMAIIAGILFVTAAGDEKKVTQAKNIITWAVIGFAIILLAKGIVGVIKQLLGA